MKSQFHPRITGVLLVGLFGIVVTAYADSGFTITTARENAVAIGMSTTDVEQLIGRPAYAMRYRSSPGPVWTYRVVDPQFGRTEFNVEFGTDQKVLAKGEIVVGSESPNGGRD
jgi:hypothetical protein